MGINVNFAEVLAELGFMIQTKSKVVLPARAGTYHWFAGQGPGQEFTIAVDQTGQRWMKAGQINVPGFVSRP